MVIKEFKIFLVIVFFSLFGINAKGQLMPDIELIRNNLVDKNVTERTAIMYYNLMENSKKGVMLGQHDAFTARQINYSDKNMSDIKYTAGQNPLVGGLDFMFITDVQNTPGSWWEGQEKQIKEQAVMNYYRGILTTFTWHFRNPYTKNWFSVNGELSKIEIAKKSLKSILPGGENHEYYKGVLAKVASVFHELKDSTGTPIPFIFRPYHEFDGDWFWWGSAYCTPEEFKENWRFTVHYLRDVLQVRNIIYAFSPDNRFNTIEKYLERYPGDDYVDMVGMDNYYDFESNNLNGAALKLKIVSDYAKSRNKLAALTECGYRNNTKPNKLYTSYFLKVLKQYPLQLSYLMFWGNGQYTPIPGQNTAPDFINFLKDTLILAEGDVDDIYTFNSIPFIYINGSVTNIDKQRLDVELNVSPKEQKGFAGFTVKLDDAIIGIDSTVYSPIKKRMYIYVNIEISKNHKISLSYTDGNIMSDTDVKLSNFYDMSIENLLTGSDPMLKSAITNESGEYILLNFNKKMDLNGLNIDSLKVFESNISKTYLPISSTSYFSNDSSTIAMQLTDFLYSEYNLTVTYNDTAFYSIDGGKQAGFYNKEVKNHSPGFPPKIVSGDVLSDGSGVKVIFNKDLQNNTSITSKFDLNINGIQKNVIGMTILLNSITLRVENAIKYGDNVLVSFSNGNIFSLDRGVLSVINNFQVKNTIADKYVTKYINNINISAVSPIYNIDSAYIGNLMYSDRTYLFTDLSHDIIGSEYLIWQNNLKDYQASTLLSFSLLESGNLYVAHDNRLSKPDWLINHFNNTNLSFAVPDSRLTLYEKYCDKNQLIELGANQIKGTETGASTNFIIFFVPEKRISSTAKINNDNSINIYPNPCQNVFTISSGDFKFKRIEIFNSLGVIVYSKAIEYNPVNKISFNLKPGLYIVRVSNGKSYKSHLLEVTSAR